MTALRIDEEFSALCLPLREDEAELLEDSLRAEGCREPLVAWQDTLVDGHNRHAICLRLGIPF